MVYLCLDKFAIATSEFLLLAWRRHLGPLYCWLAVLLEGGSGAVAKLSSGSGVVEAWI
jgi:hypothetical protein